MNRSDILVHHHAVPFSCSYDTYEWVGDPRGVVEIDCMFIPELDKLPWKLKQVGEFNPWEDPLRQRLLYIRTDVSFWWVEWCRKELSSRVHLFWMKVSRRLLATAVVWDLVTETSYYSGLTHTWRDLKLVNWVRKLWRK